MKLAILVSIYGIFMLLCILLLFPALRGALPGRRKGSLSRSGFLILLLVLLALAFPLIGALIPDGPLDHFFQRWGNVILGFVLYFFGMLLFVELFRLIRKLVTRKRGPWSRGPACILLILLLAVTIGLNIWGVRTATDVKVTNYRVAKEEMDLQKPIRIVLIGDLHIGVNSHQKIYEDMIARINEQDADLVLVAGDIVTSSFSAMGDPDTYSSIMKKIRAKYGTYVIYGNHDVDEPLLGGFTYDGSNAERNPGMAPFLRDCGWTLLTDEVTKVGDTGIILIGRRDESRPGDGVKKRADMALLMEEAKARGEGMYLLLQHEPSELEQLSDLGVNMSVSGHTHDGQLFPGNIYSRLTANQSYGLKKWGDTDVVVTSGVGFYGPPLRIGTISEIAVIDIQ